MISVAKADVLLKFDAHFTDSSGYGPTTVGSMGTFSFSAFWAELAGILVG